VHLGPRCSNFAADVEHFFIWGRLHGVETSITVAFEECSPRLLLLDRKMMAVKLKKHIVITHEAIYRNKILASFWNMKNVFEMDITSRGSQNSTTNMVHFHT
jgi:hypothetical protein